MLVVLITSLQIPQFSTLSMAGPRSQGVQNPTLRWQISQRDGVWVAVLVSRREEEEEVEDRSMNWDWGGGTLRRVKSLLASLKC